MGGGSRLWRRGGGIGGSRRGSALSCLLLLRADGLFDATPFAIYFPCFDGGGGRATIMGVETGNWTGWELYFWSVVGLPALGGQNGGWGGELLLCLLFSIRLLLFVFVFLPFFLFFSLF